MFEAGVSLDTDRELARSGRARVRCAARGGGKTRRADAGEGRPPALMVALHVWSMTHGIASLFGRGDAARRALPMPPEELLEAAVLIYLRGLGICPEAAGRRIRRRAVSRRSAVPGAILKCEDPCAVLTSRRPAPIHVNVIYIHARPTMTITAKLDEFGKPAWIALIVLGSWSGGRSAWPSSPSPLGAEEWDADITAARIAGSTRWNACSARWTGCARA